MADHFSRTRPANASWKTASGRATSFWRRPRFCPGGHPKLAGGVSHRTRAGGGNASRRAAEARERSDFEENGVTRLFAQFHRPYRAEFPIAFVRWLTPPANLHCSSGAKNHPPSKIR
jgi:hypothetical protein